MSYGPFAPSASRPKSASVLAYGGGDRAEWCWNNGLSVGTLATFPACSFVLTLRDGKKATANFPSTASRVLVDDPGRERVTMHWGRVEQGRLFGLRRRTAMGCHLFVEERSDGLIVVEIVPSNGQVDPTKHFSHLGAVAYRAAEFKVLDAKWEIVGIGVFCSGVDAYLISRAWTAERVVLCRRGDAAAKARAQQLLLRSDLHLPAAGSIVAADLVEYPRTGFPVQQPLQLSGVPTNGMLEYDRNDAQVGSPPKGEPDAPAGFRVEPARAWQANENAARAAANDVPRLLAGNPLACFDSATGEPVWPERWPLRGEYNLTGQRTRFDNYVTPSSFTLVTELGWNVNKTLPREFNPEPCPSKGLALNYAAPFDSAHLSRITACLQSAWLLTRSWAAWLAMRMIACDSMTGWSFYGRPWDQYRQAFSLGTALASARAKPGRNGIGYLREQAWVADAVAGALVSTPRGPERDRYLRWRDGVLELQALSNFKSGINNAGVFPNSYNGVPWNGYGLPPEFGTASTFQVALWAVGMHKLIVSGPVTPYSTKVAADICAAATTLYDNPALPLKNGSPPYYLGVTKNGVAEHPISVGVGRAHDSVVHGFDHLARCALLTGDRDKWLLQLGTKIQYPPVSGTPALRQALTAKIDCWRALALKVTA